VRIEVGFEGGQVIGGFVESASADELENALHQDGPRVVVLELEDGRYHVVVPRVSYFRRFNRASRVGFAAG
jgi:pheromone shutdown protein TraB